MKGINSLLQFGFVALRLCFFVTEVAGTLDVNSDIYIKQTSSILSRKDINGFADIQDSSSNASACDCGENSESCELKNGVKICKCVPGYAPGNYQNCAPTCNSTQKCNNGGRCFDNVCICLPGTSGPYCDIIDGCSELNCGKDKNASCSFDQKNFKAFCSCKQWRYVFDYEENICKECDCDGCEKGKMCLSKARKCEFIQGKKTCTCSISNIAPNKFNPKTGRCEICSPYNAETCDFDQNGKNVYRCKSNYKMRGIMCSECDCGYSGSCWFRNYDKVCSCNSGYSEDRGTCRACDCGNGKCEFYFQQKTKCICDPGYYEESGKCREVKTCYCGENASCKYEKGVKKCDCAEGYQEINGMCADINECDNPKMCHSNMTCINTDGGYECVCKKGFQELHKQPGKCEDINECLVSRNSCPDANTLCFNTVGSYKCYCISGYATRVDEDSPVVCESKSAWHLGYGLLIGIFLFVIMGLVIMIYKYR